MFLMELDPSEYTGPFNPEPIDLFSYLSEKQKVRGKRKGIRMAKMENLFYKMCNIFQQNGG